MLPLEVDCHYITVQCASVSESPPRSILNLVNTSPPALDHPVMLRYARSANSQLLGCTRTNLLVDSELDKLLFLLSMVVSSPRARALTILETYYAYIRR